MRSISVSNTVINTEKIYIKVIYTVIIVIVITFVHMISFWVLQKTKRE